LAIQVLFDNNKRQHDKDLQTTQKTISGDSALEQLCGATLQQEARSQHNM